MKRPTISRNGTRLFTSNNPNRRMAEEKIRIDLEHPVTVCKASAGTGKTFTLAAYYIGLLMSGVDYRSILAITFTNKATAEMSERILTNLYEIWHGTADAEFMESMRSFMFRNRDKDAAWIAGRAEWCFKQMLSDFDNVKIQTIDSFLQTLLTGLAGMLHQSAGMNTELDSDHVIGEAVEQLLTTEMTEQDLTIMRDFLYMRLEQEGTVYIKKSLVALAKELYNESVQMLDSRGEIVFDAAQIAARRERLSARRDNSQEILRLRTETEQMMLQLEGMELTGCGHVTTSIKSAIKDIRESLYPPEDKNKPSFRGLKDEAYSAAKAYKGDWSKVPTPIYDSVMALQEAARRCRAYYATMDLSVALSYEMQLMSSLQRLIRRNLAEANSALLSRTASVLNEALRSGDADFILEKAGIRYHHVLMDEFQDTSKLQWSVIEKLLQELVAGAGNTILIVGDIKQSIYRWRNGDWHIMDELANAQAGALSYGRLNKRFTSLQKNFRSSEKVVKFNLSFFDYMMANYPNFHEQALLCDDEAELIRRIYKEDYKEAKLSQFYQADKKQGGYVRFKAYEEKDECLTALFDTIESLLPNIRPTDMMVLVRFGADAQLITNAHAALDAADYPKLSKVNFVSASSFQLDASEAVNTIIAALHIVANNNDQVAAYQVSLAVGKPNIVEQICAQVTVRTPLYEAVCELVKLLLTDENGQYLGSETAYIDNLLDRTREYVRAYGSDIPEFLDYWAETLHEKPIPTSAAGAIRIMTIHKSKGLQAQTLFIPFCNWKMDEGKASTKIWCPIAPELEEGSDYIPIPNKNDAAESAYQPQYMDEHMNLRVDSLNMLYVALTRAEDNLYVFTDYKEGSKGAKPKHVGTYLVEKCGSTDYEEGQVVVKGVSGKSGKDKSKPFAFDTASQQQAELWANSEQVRFIQSQEGALYTENSQEAYRRVTQMEEGTLCHEIFANIRQADELDAVLDDFETRGEIRDKAQREELRTLISSAWNGNEQMRSWFVDPWELKLEQAILQPDKEIRPDRVMIDRNTNEAIVLDYKFGRWNEHYITQVREYMDALRQLGHPRVRGYLWFARENRLIEVKGGQA